MKWETFITKVQNKILNILKKYQKKHEEIQLESFKQDGSFFELGTNILENNGWTKNGNCWINLGITEFKIYENIKDNSYVIRHNDAGFKELKIIKTENILKRISEYKIYLKTKKRKITKDSFLSDFE